jgi:hypothetical protein
MRGRGCAAGSFTQVPTLERKLLHWFQNGTLQSIRQIDHCILQLLRLKSQPLDGEILQIV